MASVERMQCPLSTSHGFDLFPDHNNPIFLLDSTSTMADLSQATLRQLLCWARHLSAYNYTCVHLPGNESVWEDIIADELAHVLYVALFQFLF